MGTIEGRLDAGKMRIAVVVSRWNELVTKELLAGALDALKAAGASDPTIVRVAGTWEIPPIAKALIDGKKVDGVIALGCILQGATPHAGLLARDVSSALMGLQVSTGVPISWGVLTPENMEQALERSGMKHGNKGREAAQALIDSLSVLAQLR